MVNQAKKELNINDEREVRLAKLSDLIVANVNPYPAHVERSHTVKEALNKSIGDTVIIAGRLVAKREMGKLSFSQIQDESGKIQIVIKKDEIKEEDFKLFTKKIDLGDFLTIEGERFQTKNGEESILVKKWTLLSKALRPLPDKFHGLQDDEVRYRKRYLDFLANPEQKEKIIIRSKVVRYMREFFYEKDFIEVETPMLETVASGAMAKKFDTHLNAFDLPVHLRICIGELWQKRLMVGGFEKTFEIGRAFRNEGVDFQHNPEFTMVEFYWAFANLEDNIKLHEEMLPFIIEKSIGTLKVTHEGNKIDFTAPYPRVTFHDVVLKYSGIDINDHDTPQTLAKAMKEKQYEVEPGENRRSLLDSLYKQAARPHIIQPTFVLDYPVELKPLAKKAEDPRYTNMFQLLVNGFELSNSYTELNDPVDQKERFEAQAKAAAEGDEEAMEYDEDYVEALEHGMPPTTGTGIGIDRLVALITGSHTIREVTAFPLMKPKDSSRLHHSPKESHTHKSEKNEKHRLATSLPIDRNQAWELVKKYNTDQSDMNHYLESEAVLRAIAKHLGRDEEYWGMLGLVHDIDWGLTKDDPKTHLTKMPDIMREVGFDNQFIKDIMSHGYGCECADLEKMTRDCEIQYALAAGETVTGLVHASARMRPDKIASLKTNSLKKKFKNKKFAAKIDRDVILECEKIGIELDDFLNLSINAIKGIADQVGLA